MRSPGSLRSWLADLLPHAAAPAREGAWQLLTGLLAGFTTSLCDLARHGAARQPGRKAASQRQYLFRWLQRLRWVPTTLYVRLLRRWPPALKTAPTIPLLIDCTVLGDGWNVLQVSVPFQRRALPVYRAVVAYRTPEQGQTVLLQEALAWLREHLPGPHTRYVVILDRGFPSHALLQHLREQGWRYVVRLGGHWKMTHADYTGVLQAAVPALAAGGTGCCRWFPHARLGGVGASHKRTPNGSTSSVAVLADPQHADVWILATSEPTAAAAITLYRQRMQIEAEFRDLKGPLGLDHLEHWRDRDRVARLLAWVAVYEWRLAWLWETRPLAAWGRHYLQIGGDLSWINVTRQWVHRHWRTALGPPTTVRESP